ncbi:MAG: hypothetical protein AB8I69_15650 [Anaerolineae bacterium]|jgi:hypothetical protein
MKKVKYLGALVLLLASLLAACCTPTTPPASTEPPPAATEPPADKVPTEEVSGSWEAVLDLEVEQTLRMAAFLDARVGYTGGEATEGRAHYTTDGGQTWTMAESSGG